MKKEIEISVISPVYRAEDSVNELVDRLVHELQAITKSFEIVLVEDGSPDRSWEKIERCCLENEKVVGIKLSRNFGQHAAITAGLQSARGKYVVLLDCDLQDDPVYIKDLYAKAKEGYDIVYAAKTKRKHSFIRNVLSHLYNKIFNNLANHKRVHSRTDVGTFSILSRKVVTAFLQMNDYHRHYLILLRWLGFSSAFIEVEHRERKYGRSSYNLSKMIHLALDGITSQSDKLLVLSVNVGICLFIGAMIFAAYLVVNWFLHGYQEGWTSLMVAIVASTGCIMMSLGVVGIYVGKIFEQSKGRPLYLIDKTIDAFAVEKRGSYEQRRA